MSAPLTLQLDQDQLKAVFKQMISSHPDLLTEVMDELRAEQEKDRQFDKVVDDLFTKYDDVFRALA